MGAIARRLEVVITGNTRGLGRAFNQAGDSADSFGRRMSKVGKIVGAAALGAGVAVTAGFVATLKRGFEELSESQKVTAQTAAAIKSTGGAANVTAEQVEKLASALSRKTGIDDEVIHASENLLLTFKNVRDEVGKGNDVFARATAAGLDLATAGFGTPETAAKMLGKALNDPVRGMTALSRAGVTFSDKQKAAIKALVETGNVLGAQKLILKEVESQVGGSAKAYGETLPGQLAKARNAFDEVAGRVALKLLPALTQALDWVNAHWPQISATIEAVSSAIITSVSAVAGFIREQVIPAVSTVVDYVRANWPQISATAKKVFGEVSSLITGVVGVIRALWDRFGSDLVSSARATWAQISGQVKGALDIIRGLVKIVSGLLHGDFSQMWDGIKQVFSGALTSIAASLRGMVTIWGTIAKALGKAILDGIGAGLSALAGLMTRSIGALLGVLQRAVGTAMGHAKEIGAGILRGVSDGLTGLVLMVQGWFQTLWAWIKGAARSAYAFALNVGKAIVKGIAGGITAAAGEAYAQAERLVGGIKNKLEFWKSPPSDYGKWLGTELVKGLTSALTSGAKDTANAAGQLVGGAKSAAVKGLNEVGRAIVAAAKKYGVDARAALAVAMGEGGVKFGAVGDSGTSFGPFQLHIGGASPFSDPAKAAQFANSIAGIEYAIRKMAETGARGKTGFDAINAIIRNFERPLDPDSSVRNAIARYGSIPAAIGNAVTSAGPIVGGAVKNQLAQIAAAVQAAAPAIGLAKARGIVAGFLQAAPTLTQQIKQALSQAATEAIQAAAAKVKEARDAFGSAFGELASSALAAFDSQVAKWKSPAAKLLAKMQLEDQLKQLNSAITAGTAGIETAQAGLTAALAGGDPEAIKAAQAAVLAAQETFNQAVRAKEEFNLGQLAAKQEAAHAKAMERKRVQFENQLIQLQNALARHPEEHEKIQGKIKKLLEKFVPGFQASGAAIGYAIAQGLRESTAAVEREAEKLAQAIANKLKLKSPAKEGPLSTLDSWWKGFAPTLLSGLDMKAINGALALATPGGGTMPGASGRMAGGGGMAMAGGGGDTHIHMHLHGGVYAGDRALDDLALKVRDKVVRGGIRNGGGMLAGQG